MRKYIYIYKSELMSSMQYVLNILFRVIGFVILVFVFMNLWNYIYEDPNELINGYSKSQMIWYVIITEIIWSSTEGRRFCRKISDDVKSGNIAYIMNKPYNYIIYAISSHLGETTIRAIISITIGLGLGLLFLGSFPSISILSVIIVLLTGILAVIINSLFVAFIGMISFIIEDSNPIFWLYSKCILILGTLFPIEFFPGVIGQIVKCSPIYVTCYGPAKLFVDFSFQNALDIFIAQAIYLGIAGLMCYALYRKGVKKLNVTGG